jgi:hypothetical protein
LLDWHDPPLEPGDPGDFVFTHGGTVPIFVLYATAIENLLKAARVAVHGSPVKDDKLPKSFANHRFVDHARVAGFQLDDGDERFLRHLADLMEGGRYPVPLVPGGTPDAWHFTTPKDVEHVWTLAERSEAFLREHSSDVLPVTDLRARYRPIGYGLMNEEAESHLTEQAGTSLTKRPGT